MPDWVFNPFMRMRVVKGGVCGGCNATSSTVTFLFVGGAGVAQLAISFSELHQLKTKLSQSNGLN